MRLALAAVLALLPALPALAEGRFALVIAAGDYEQLRDLQNPGNDAMAIGAELARLGFEVTIETERDRRRTRRALQDFAEDAAGADIALVYYAGHGVEVAGENHLLPVDADAGSTAALAASAIPLAELAEALTAIAPRAILLVDACRDDPFAGTALAADGRSATEIADGAGTDDMAGDAAVAPGFARVGRADGLLYGFATAPGAVALDGTGDHSPYAEALLRHLAKPGLSLPTILTLVAQDVYDRSDNRQLPYFESALPDLVFVTAAPPDLSERDALLLAMAGLTPELRAEVERIAALNDVPLAPLYAAMLSADLASLTLTEREAQLTAAATEYRAFIAQVAAPGEDDPRILALRNEAAELMRLGAYGEAQAKYDQALALGAARATSASDALVAETLSLVETLKASALAAQANLDHETAIARYRQIADDLGKVEALGLPIEALLDRTNALWTIGDLLVLTGDLEGAGQVYDAMRDILSARSSADPQNTEWQRDLSVSWNKLGDIRKARGDLAGAETAYGDALKIRQALTARDPQNTEWLRGLSVSWDRIGDIRKARGDLAGAEAAYGDALEIRQPLTAKDPQNTKWQSDLSVSWVNIGDIRKARGDLAGAEAAYGDALKIRQALTARDPQNTEWQRDLSVSWDRIGDIRLAQGDLAGAEAAYGDALKIRQALIARDPQNTEWQRDLSVSWNRIGDIRSARGDLAGAEAAYGDDLKIAQALTARDPQNTDWQRDLAVSWDRIGDIRLAQGDLAGAEAAHGDALKIRQALIARDPQNTEWQRDLSVSWDRIGDIRKARGDQAGAEAAYGDALKIRQALASIRQGSTEAQLYLVVSHVKLALVVATPRPHLQEALAILERLQAEGRLPPANAGWIDIVRAELAGK